MTTETDEPHRRPLAFAASTTRSGVASLPLGDQLAIMRKVMTFDAFTPDNDPYGEHDFGAFDHKGQKLIWKINYFALDMEHGSEDPAYSA